MTDELLKNAAQALNTERFKLILFPTERCNFRCIYCYEDHIGNKMSMEIVESVKRFLIMKIPTVKLFELEWFGGEPLLAKDIVREITKLAQRLCLEHNVTFVSVMTTNGYLLDLDTFKELLSLGINSFQITFDGDRDNHNKYRLPAEVKAVGIGTFDVIWNNLIETKKCVDKFAIAIRCHLTQINYESTVSLLNKIRNSFGEDNRYFVHLKEVSALGGKDDDKMKLLSKEEKQCLINKLKQEFSDLQYVDIGKDYICYAAKPNTFAIRSDGSIVKCTVALDCEHNNVGKLLTDGTLQIDSVKFLTWSKGFENMDKSQLDCPYYHVIKKM